MLGHGVATPLLPMLGMELGATAATVGGALSAFGAARLALNIPVGILCDRAGRMPLLVGGAALNAVGCALCGMAMDATQLLAARAVAGAGSAAYLGTVQVYLNDVTTKGMRARTLGLNHAALLCGVSFGPAIGGVVAELTGSLRLPFALVAMLSGAAAVHALALPETLRAVAPRSTSRVGAGAMAAGAVPVAAAAHTPWTRIATDPRFLAAGLAHATTFALRQGGRNVLLALAAATLFSYSPMDLGQLFGAMACMDLAAVTPAAWLADRVPTRWLAVPSILLSAAGLCVVAIGCAAQRGSLLEAPEAGEAGSCAVSPPLRRFSTEHAAIGAPQPGDDMARRAHAIVAEHGHRPHDVFLSGVLAWCVGTMAIGPALPAYAAALAPSNARGVAIALFRSCGDVGFVVAPVVLGLLADHAGTPAAMVALALSAGVSAGAFGVFGRPRRLK